MGVFGVGLGLAQAAAGMALLGGDAALGVGRTVGGMMTGTAASAAVGAVAIARGATGILAEAAGATPARRCSTTGAARWIEVRGLDTDPTAVTEAVGTALRSVAGVTGVHINGPTARAVVTVTPDGPSAAELARVVAAAESQLRERDPRQRPQVTSLPGDDVLLVGRAVATTVSAMGLGAAVVGKILPMPGWARMIPAPVGVADYHPRLRHRIEDRLGSEGADFAFACIGAVTAVLAVSPFGMVANTATRAMQTAEALNGRRAWGRMAPELTAQARKSGDIAVARTASQARHFRTGAVYAERSVDVGLGTAAVLGITSDMPTAASAVMVATPKANRTVREAFACAIGRGLHNDHHGLVLRPAALRWLGELDTVVVDPRVLFTDELTISRIRGIDAGLRSAAWTAATAALDAAILAPGWNPLSTVPGGDAFGAGEALVSAVRDPLASALVTEARRAGARVVTVHDDGLHSLRQGFDEIRSPGTTLDDTLSATVAELRSGGAKVVLLAQGGDAASLEADLAIGIRRDGLPPPWGADILLPDLAGAWRMMRALPAARVAAQKGVSMSAGSSVLGALMLIPSVPGSGPASVELTATAGLWTGFRLGRMVFDEPLPHPEAGHDWYALPVEQVERLLPRPAPETATAPAGLLGAVTSAPPVRRSKDVAEGAWRSVRDYGSALREDLDDPISPILATGAAASALLGSPIDAVMVASVLVVNAAISAQQTVHAEHILDTMLAVQEPPARRLVGPVDRGHTEDIPSGRLRPGDLIEVRSGEVVPADCRLLHAVGVEVDESALTGESLPVSKNGDATPGAPLAERTGMVFAGTTMVAGRAVAIVTEAGPATQARRALAMSPGKSHEVGLAAQLSDITRRALPWSLAGGLLVGVLSLLRGTPIRDTASGTVSIGVAAVPEGLPLVVTLAQSASARRLTGSSVLVRNPRAIEAFARLDAVCFDKTGTLSENHLRVTSVRPYADHTDEQVLAAAVHTMPVTTGRRAEHATDQAIREGAERIGVLPTRCAALLPFQSDRPFAAALLGDRIVVKGAPEVLLTAVDDVSRAELATVLTDLTAAGSRVLAVAERSVTGAQAAAAVADPDTFESLCLDALTPLGLVGLADTPRPGARPLLEELQRRDIGIKLITGDHPVTAAVIADELGVPVTPDEVLTGAEWESMTAAQRSEAAQRYRVFARMSPEHKVHVVQALEAEGLVTAMVGDGANDAAAIRAASVGVGVVSAGSDPARMAADVMLLDGDIAALVDALDEGEQLWRRVHSAVSVLLGHNVGEVSFGLITSVITGRPALNARQMLLINMLTDALPAAALAVSEQTRTDDVVAHDESAIWRAVAERAVFTTLGATIAWVVATPLGPRRAATVGLIGLVLSQMLEILSDSHGPLVVATNVGTVAMMAAIISIPGVSQLFGCTPVGPVGWGIAVAAAVAAGVIAKLVPGIVDRGIGRLQESVVDDENADPHQDGVDMLDGRGQQPSTGADQGVGADAAHNFAHDGQPNELDGNRKGLPNNTMLDSVRNFVSAHHEASTLVRDATQFSIDLPGIGKVAVPPPDRIAFYGALAILAVTEMIPWPVAIGIGAGHALALRNTEQAVEIVAAPQRQASAQNQKEVDANAVAAVSPARKAGTRKARKSAAPAKRASTRKATPKKVAPARKAAPKKVAPARKAAPKKAPAKRPAAKTAATKKPAATKAAPTTRTAATKKAGPTRSAAAKSTAAAKPTAATKKAAAKKTAATKTAAAKKAASGDRAARKRPARQSSADRDA